MSNRRFRGVGVAPNQNIVGIDDRGHQIASNAVCDPRPTSIWGYKGCAGKGGKTTNAVIIEKKTEKENA